MSSRKWKNVGHQMYESGPWVITNQSTFLNPTAGWAIYKDRIFVDRLRTFKDAKNAVSRSWAEKPPGFMELAGAGIVR